jgi:hypothetical protein
VECQQNQQFEEKSRLGTRSAMKVLCSGPLPAATGPRNGYFSLPRSEN